MSSSIFIEEYSEKCIVVRGDTRLYRDQLKNIGGKWNSRLRNNPGWVFPKKSKEVQVKEWLNSLTLISNQEEKVEEQKVEEQKVEEQKVEEQKVEEQKKERRERKVEKKSNSWGYLSDTDKEQLVLEWYNEFARKNRLVGWECRLSGRLRSSAGNTSYKGLIQISKKFVLHPEATPEQIKNTLLHEIAHALTPGHNHDKVWKSTALRIGCSGDRCHNYAFVDRELKYTLECQKCRKLIRRRIKANLATYRCTCLGELKYI